MNQANSLSFEQLLDWIDGRLPERDAEEIARQVAAADADTQTLVTWLRAFRQMSKTTVMARPPAKLRNQLRQHFKEEHGRPGYFRRLIANLTFDSALHRPAGDMPRQLNYSTEVALITLKLQPDPHGQHLTLIGRVSPVVPNHQPYSVQLLRGDHEEAITLTSESGEFAFETVTPDVYDMILSSEQIELFATDIELHA